MRLVRYFPNMKAFSYINIVSLYYYLPITTINIFNLLPGSLGKRCCDWTEIRMLENIRVDACLSDLFKMRMTHVKAGFMQWISPSN